MKTLSEIKSTAASSRMKFLVKIVGKKQLADGTLGISLEKPRNFSYRAGQYILLHIPSLKEKGARESTHSMSLASAPHQEHLFVVMRISQSDFKQTLNNMAIGDVLEIDGPLGNLWPENIDRPVVFIAGGIGIAPFYGIIEEQRKMGWPRAVSLLYANRRPEDAAFLEEFSAIANDKFCFVPTMTRLDENDKTWAGERGRVSAALIKKNIKDLSAPLYFIVGLPEMVKATKAELAKLNISPDNIKVESFSGYQTS